MVLFFLYLFIVELGKRYDFFVDNIKICYNELEKKIIYWWSVIVKYN